MALTGVIHRRDKKSAIIQNPPRVGEIVYALDTEEYGSLQNGTLIWKKFDDIVKSVAGRTGIVELDKFDVGLGNVDNTSDLDKPMNTETKNVIDAHKATINAHGVTTKLLNLENVDNTSDMNKPVSTATQIAINDARNSINEVNNALHLGGIEASKYALIENYFTKLQTSDLLNTKENVGVAYKKSETDSLLDAKADESELDVTNSKVQSLESTIVEKADKTYVDSQDTTLQTNIDKKADKITVNNISDKVDTNITNISTNKTSINTNKNNITVLDAQKADKSYVDSQDDALETKINTNTTNISNLDTNKADKTYVDSQDDAINKSLTDGLALKADKTYVDTQDDAINKSLTDGLALKADITYVDDQVSSNKGVSKDYVDSKVDNLQSTKADKTYVDSQDDAIQSTLQDNITNGLATKADKTYVDTQDTTLQDNINTNKASTDSDISNLQSTKADKTYVDTQDTALQNDINSKINTVNQNKADITYVDTQDNTVYDTLNAQKADITYVDTQDNAIKSTLQNNIDNNKTAADDSITDLQTKKADITYVDTQDNYLDSHKAEITYVDSQDTALQNNINKKADITYVDSAVTGLDAKEAVKVASTDNIDLATGGLLTIDGEALVAGDRVLVKNQTNSPDNGIYDVVDGAWTRSSDADNNPGSEVKNGMYVFATDGTVNANTGWILSSPDSPIDLGTSNISFSKFSNVVINAADILTKLKTVDGTGSGLDADLLDGKDSAFYENASNLNAGTISNDRLPASITSDITGNSASSNKWETTRIITVNGDQTGSVSIDGSSDVTLTLSNVAANLLSDLKTVDGSGSGLDADLLDGKDSSVNATANTIVLRDSNGYINGKASDADKLDGHDSSYFATADTGSNGSVTTLNDQWHNASDTLSGYVNDGGGNSGFRFNATPGATNKLVKDGQAFRIDFENDTASGNTGRFSFFKGTSANSTAGDDITWEEVFYVEQDTGRFRVSNQTILQAGSWSDDKGNDTQGVIIQGTAPALYFDQTDSDDANAYVGINGGSFYILPDANSDGTYVNEGPYCFNTDISTGNTTIGGFVSGSELIARENVLKIQRNSSTNQYIQIDEDTSVSTAPTFTSYSAVDNAKILIIESTTNVTNDTPTSGQVGIEMNLLGNTIINIKTDEVDITKNTSVNGNLYFNNHALISNTDGSGTNIDHIWHNDTENSWNFVTDGSYKVSGNSRLNAGSLSISGGVNNGNGDGFKINSVSTISVADKQQEPFRIAQTFTGDNTPTADRVLRGMYTSITDNSTGNNTTDKERMIRGLDTYTVINGDSTRNFASQSFADSRKSSGTLIELKGAYNVARDYSKDGVTAQNVFGSMSLGIKGKYGSETDSNLSNLFGAYNKTVTESDYTKNITYARGTYSEVEINGTDDVHFNTVEAYKAIIDNNKASTNIDNAYLFRGSYEGPIPASGYAWGVYIDSDVGNYFKGYIKTDHGILSGSLTSANGSEIILNAGESSGKVSGETMKSVYVNAESGFIVNTPDRAHSNWDTGYTVETTTIRGDIVSLGNTQVYAHGDDRIRLKPDAAGGNVTIRFDSNQNYNSDYGWVKYFDDNDKYNKWGDSAENSAMVMGVTNDGQDGGSDVVALESPAGIFLNAPDVYVGDKTTLKNFSANDVYVGGTLTEASDERIKENVETINNALDKVKKLRGVEYNKIKTPDVKEIGFIAQEVEEIVPEIVKTDKDGMKSVSYQRTVALLTEAMKTQQKTIDAQQKDINELKMIVKELSEAITK